MTRESVTPASSHTSRLTASSTDSAGSMNPARVEYQFGGKRLERPRRIRFASQETTATMMVGSVRGKERLDRVVRVVHAGFSTGLPSASRAASVGGQARFVPEFTEIVRLPQVPQKLFRVFQSTRARPWAYIAAVLESS